MDKDLAAIILSACYRSARELGSLAPLIERYCNEETRSVLRSAIGEAIYDIMENVAKPVSAQSPEAQADIEARLAKFERAC